MSQTFFFGLLFNNVFILSLLLSTRFLFIWFDISFVPLLFQGYFVREKKHAFVCACERKRTKHENKDCCPKGKQDVQRPRICGQWRCLCTIVNWRERKVKLHATNKTRKDFCVLHLASCFDILLILFEHCCICTMLPFVHLATHFDLSVNVVLHSTTFCVFVWPLFVSCCTNPVAKVAHWARQFSNVTGYSRRLGKDRQHGLQQTALEQTKKKRVFCLDTNLDTKQLWRMKFQHSALSCPFNEHFTCLHSHCQSLTNWCIGMRSR